METSTVKIIGFTPVISLLIVLASVAVYGGTTTWAVIYVALGFANVASAVLAVADRQMMLHLWDVSGPAPLWNLLSPAAYLFSRGRATRSYEWAAYRPLWRWALSVAIVIFVLFMLSLWGGVFLKFQGLTLN